MTFRSALAAAGFVSLLLHRQPPQKRYTRERLTAKSRWENQSLFGSGFLLWGTIGTTLGAYFKMITTRAA